MADVVPAARFDTNDFPARERFERWTALNYGLDTTLPEGATAEAFSCRMEARLLGGLIVTHGRLSAVVLTRTQEQVDADGIDYYAFTLMKRGGWRGTFGGRTAEIGPGQVCVLDYAHPYSTDCRPNEFIIVNVPRAAIAASSAPLHGLILDGVPGRMLAEHFLSLVRHIPQAQPADVAVLEQATVRLLASCLEGLAPPPEASGPASATRDRARALIERRMTDPGLSPAQLGRDLAITRPTLYRAFAASGGVANYIQQRRLEAAHVALSDPAEERAVSDVAVAHGFNSHSHFSKAFRRRFGYAPRDTPAGPLSGSKGDTAAQFHEWLLELNGPPRR